MKIYLHMNNGGMGNQMYQYAMARKLMEVYGGEIVCDLEKFSYKGSNATRRGYVLHQFNITNRIVYTESNLTNRVYAILKHVMRFFLKNVSKEKRYKIMTKLGMFVPDGYFDDFDASQVARGIKRIYVNGLFQEHKGFDDILPILREEFSIKTSQRSEITSIIEQVESENAICVHWRRGDYLSPQYCDSLFVCDEDYYKKAIADISGRVKNPVFYVFTNSAEDAEYIKSILPTDKNIKYINLLVKEEHTDVDDFWIMCKCKHFIISNSTFSWWAQYLSASPGKIVYAPSIWHRKLDARSLYQDNWTIIDVDE